MAPFASARELSFAANDDASLIAWVDSGRLWIKWQHSGAMHPIWPRPPEEQAALQQRREAALEAASQGGGGRRGGGASAALEAAPWLNRGSVLALQWSPDGRRLLFLLHAGPARKPCCCAWWGRLGCCCPVGLIRFALPAQAAGCLPCRLLAPLL